MNTIAPIELLILEFKEIEAGIWEPDEAKALAFYREQLNSYPPGPIEGSASIRNIGQGADWDVIALKLAPYALTGFFAIPKAHKHIRESIEEWLRIFSEVKKLFSWLIGKKRALYPDSYLFLFAACYLADTVTDYDLIFRGCYRLPVDTLDMQGNETLLFSFSSTDSLEQVAISRFGEVLWHNRIELSADTA